MSLILDNMLSTIHTSQVVPLSQSVQEDVTVGPSTTGFDAAIDRPAISGSIDSVRLSNVVRYTASFGPPTAKLPWEDNTLILVNFDDNPSGTTKAMSPLRDEHGNVIANCPSGSLCEQTMYLPVHRTVEPNGTPTGQLVGTTLRNFVVTGGIFGMNAVQGQYQNLKSIDSGHGMVLEGTSENSLFDEVALNGYAGRSRYGFFTSHGNHNVHHAVTAVGFQSQLVLVDGVDQNFTSFFGQELAFSPSKQPGLYRSSTVYDSYIIRSSGTFIGLTNDDEALSSLTKGNIVIVDPPSRVQLLNGELDNGATSTNQIIPITIEGGNGVLVAGTNMSNTMPANTNGDPANPNACPEFIHLNGATSQPNVAIGLHSNNMTAPVSDDPAIQSIGN
ncbi:MAG TPA: hypothetical protein VNO21_24700 [Polyangiaceae bacterium]|nr:hypothetical protein [Polyangiaceae bacterium]